MLLNVLSGKTSFIRSKNLNIWVRAARTLFTKNLFYFPLPVDGAKSSSMCSVFAHLNSWEGSLWKTMLSEDSSSLLLEVVLQCANSVLKKKKKTQRIFETQALCLLLLCREPVLNSNGQTFPSKEPVSFNFVAAVTVGSDFGAYQNKMPVFTPPPHHYSSLLLLFYISVFCEKLNCPLCIVLFNGCFLCPGRLTCSVWLNDHI